MNGVDICGVTGTTLRSSFRNDNTNGDTFDSKAPFAEYQSGHTHKHSHLKSIERSVFRNSRELSTESES